MFLQLKILTKDYKFVLDTGSVVTIISLVVFNEISSYADYKLCPTVPNFKIEIADKAPLRIEGVVFKHFKVRNTSFHWDMYVAEIQEDGLIGLDFLKDKYSRLLGVIILLCNSPVTLLFLQRKYPISYR